MLVAAHASSKLAGWSGLRPHQSGHTRYQTPLPRRNQARSRALWARPLARTCGAGHGLRKAMLTTTCYTATAKHGQNSRPPSRPGSGGCSSPCRQIRCARTHAHRRPCMTTVASTASGQLRPMPQRQAVSSRWQRPRCAVRQRLAHRSSCRPTGRYGRRLHGSRRPHALNAKARVDSAPEVAQAAR